MGFKVVCLGLGFALTLSACQAPSSDSTFIRPLPELSSDMKATQGSSPLGQAFADSAFKRWAQSGFNRTRELDRYANYLERSTGTIPPLNQLTLSARSYAKCGRDAYMLAPSNLWPRWCQRSTFTNCCSPRACCQPVVRSYRYTEILRLIAAQEG